MRDMIKIVDITFAHERIEQKNTQRYDIWVGEE